MKGRGYLPPRPFLFGGLGQPPLGGGFLRAFPTLPSHGPGSTSFSGFGPRFRGGLPFDLAPIGPPSVSGLDRVGWPGYALRTPTRLLGAFPLILPANPNDWEILPLNHSRQRTSGHATISSTKK